MALTVTQTDTATHCRTALGGQSECSDGGTAGSTPQTVTITGEATDEQDVVFEIDITSETTPNGSYTVRMNVTTEIMFVTWTQTTVEVRNGSCALQGSAHTEDHADVAVDSTGVKSVTFTASGLPSINNGDRLCIVLHFANSNMNDQSFSFTPDQDIDTPLVAPAGGQTFERSVTDGIVFDDPTQRAQENQQLDSLLLGSRDVRDIAKIIEDLLLLGDSEMAQKIALRMQTDGVEFSELSEKIFELINKDDLFIKQAGDAEAIHNIGVESLLFSDVALTEKGKAIAIIDGLLMRDTRQSEQENVGKDSILLADQRLMECLKFFKDLLLVADDISAPLLKVLATTDGILMDDRRVSELEKVEPDNLLIGDTRVSDLLKVIKDFLLVSDAETIEQLAQAILRTITDGLLLDDSRVYEQEKVFKDDVLVSDVFSSLRESVLTDGILLDDRRVSETDITIISHVLLADTFVKTLDKLVLDNLLLGDSSSVETTQIGQVLERSATDQLLLLSQALKDRSLVQKDDLLLSDTRVSELIRQLKDGVLTRTDRRSILEAEIRNNILLNGPGSITLEKFFLNTLFLRDQRAGEISLSATDRLLLGALSERIRELLVKNNLLIGDSVTRTVTEAVIAALVYAMLRYQDLMGITAQAQPNFLGMSESFKSDYIGITNSYVRFDGITEV